MGNTTVKTVGSYKRRNEQQNSKYRESISHGKAFLKQKPQQLNPYKRRLTRILNKIKQIKLSGLLEPSTSRGLPW